MSCLLFDDKGDRIENALFGHTGFVGGYLLRKYSFGYFYNTTNINEARNKEFGIVCICCLPSVKWMANKYPDADDESINNIMDVIRTIQAKRIILISTVDVFDNINNSNEDTVINDNNHTYGKNRYKFEVFIKQNFTNYYIHRLPALFGIGLKKNVLFDLMNNNQIEKINPQTQFQWYNMEWLSDDIDICYDNNIRECNFVSEPIYTSHIISLFPQYADVVYNYQSDVKYNITTNHYRYFVDGSNGYIHSKSQVMDDIYKFVKYKKHINLCVSNIAINTIHKEQFYGLLKHYGINYIEIAPTKFANWSDVLNSDIFGSENEIIRKYGLTIASIQSVAFSIKSNIFDVDNTVLFEHIKKVIDFAERFHIKNIVFGCPNNRRITINCEIENNQYTFIQFFRQIGDYIGERDITISIENNSREYKCNFLNTIQETGDMVMSINHKKIKMMIDIGNCIMEADNLNDIYNYKDVINHIHISMPFMRPFINYNREQYLKFRDIIHKISYSKVISLEFLSQQSKDELTCINNSLRSFIEFFNVNIIV